MNDQEETLLKTRTADDASTKMLGRIQKLPNETNAINKIPTNTPISVIYRVYSRSQMGTGGLGRILTLNPFAKVMPASTLEPASNFATDSLVQYSILSKTSVVKYLQYIWKWKMSVELKAIASDA